MGKCKCGLFDEFGIFIAAIVSIVIAIVSIVIAIVSIVIAIVPIA